MFWPECEGISEPGDQIRRSPDVIYRLLNTALRTYLTRYGAIIVLELSVSNEFVVAWVDWPHWLLHVALCSQSSIQFVSCSTNLPQAMTNCLRVCISRISEISALCRDETG